MVFLGSSFSISESDEKSVEGFLVFFFAEFFSLFFSISSSSSSESSINEDLFLIFLNFLVGDTSDESPESESEL